MRLRNRPPYRSHLLNLRVERLTSHLLELLPLLLLNGSEVLLHYPRCVCSLRVEQSRRILTNVEHVQLRVGFLRELQRHLRRTSSALRSVAG